MYWVSQPVIGAVHDCGLVQGLGSGPEKAARYRKVINVLTYASMDCGFPEDSKLVGRRSGSRCLSLVVGSKIKSERSPHPLCTRGGGDDMGRSVKEYSMYMSISVGQLHREREGGLCGPGLIQCI